MKKFRNTLLLVLLFSFSSLVVHDFMVAGACISPYQEQSLDRGSLFCDTTKNSLETVTHLHDSIHTMILLESEASLLTPLFHYNKPSFLELGFATNNNSVLERPPLS